MQTLTRDHPAAPQRRAESEPSEPALLYNAELEKLLRRDEPPPRPVPAVTGAARDPYGLD